jgi:LuxR family maltose regulon positive regulatory protein
VAQPEPVEMRWVPGLLAAVVYRAPWHPLADALAERAERLLHHETAPGQRLLLGSLAFHLLWRGQVDRLERIVLRIDSLCARQLAAPATMMRWWGVGILVKVLLGQLPSARNDVAQALALVDAEPSVASDRANVELLSMIVALGERDAAAARRSLDAAARALHPDNAVGRTTYEHQRGILALLEDDRPTALRLMRAAVVSARASGFPMREHIALIANALAAARSGEHDEAAGLLDDVFSHPFHAVCRWHHWIAGSVAAYAALCRADTPSALLHLSGALSVARECGFRAGPMLYCCGDMMAQLAALALSNDIEPETARDLIVRNNLDAPALADASWPWPVRLHSFGGLKVELNGGEPPAGRKESRRLLELLRLLIAHGESTVTLDALADELWPDAEGDAARNALDNALHRLRKWLGGDDRVLLRQRALSLNPRRCWTDVRALERILVSLDESPVDGLPALVTSLRRLYRAPLLPEDDQPTVIRRRADLHRQVERALRSAGERLAAAGQVQEAAAAIESLPDL